MKTSITVFQKDLKAVAHAMATKDVRYYLCGVLIQSNAAETRLVATDGHRLHAVQHIGQDNKMIQEPVSVILPLEMVKTCIKAKVARHNHCPEITFYIDGSQIEAALPDGTSIKSFAVDGKFPDYCRILSFPMETFTNEAAAFNPSYLVDADQGLRDYLELNKSQSHGLSMAQRGTSVGILASGGFVAAVMPTRAEMCKGFAVGLGKPLQAPEAIKQAA
jgi:DNA polymerase-3 subunit beta